MKTLPLTSTSMGDVFLKLCMCVSLFILALVGLAAVVITVFGLGLLFLVLSAFGIAHIGLDDFCAIVLIQAKKLGGVR